MSISLKIVSYHRHTPGQQEIFKADTDSFTIGRGDENDWAIPDPQKFLSGVHCRLHHESGRYFLTDVSTNGVFINGDEKRIERDSTVAVQHKDQFRIGDYEFEVLIDDNDILNAEDDEESFDDMATLVGQGQSGDDLEDDFDDPFTDPVPQQPRFADAGNDDFEKDINTPLQHIDNNPISNAVSIGSLLDLDDLEEHDSQDSTDSLRERHSPLNDAFKASHHVTSRPESAAVKFDNDFPADIPDDWDEATGMLKIPDPPAQSNSDETDDDRSGLSAAVESANKSIDLSDEWEDSHDIFESPEHQSPPVASNPVKPADVAPPLAKAPTQAPAETAVEAPHQAAPVVRNNPATSSRVEGAMAAFMTGAGLKPGDLPGIDEQVFFEQLGLMLAEFTSGLVQTLSGRTHIKSEFRLDQTMIRPVENNPLKFSTSTSNTLKQLLSQQDTAYMTGVTAIKEGFDDVNAHQMAVIAGMEAALQDILKRFNPETLETRLESDSILDNILPGGKKAKYWEMFKLLFGQIAGEAEDDFQQLFGSKFSRAYEQQLDRLKNNH